MGKEKLIQICAFIVIVIGSLSTIYTFVSQANSDFIEIDGQEFTINQLFLLGEKKTFETYSGVALDDIIINIGIINPSEREYNIVGSDGYQKTVKWENMKNGFLTSDGTSIFSDLPKAFRVREIIRIEVI